MGRKSKKDWIYMYIYIYVYIADSLCHTVEIDTTLWSHLKKKETQPNPKGIVLAVVQSLSRVRLFATPWTAARQASLSITNSWSSLKLKSTESMMPSNHLILCCPLLLLPWIFPSIRVFSSLRVFSNESASDAQSIGVSASASFLPMNIQD